MLPGQLIPRQQTEISPKPTKARISEPYREVGGRPEEEESGRFTSHDGGTSEIGREADD